MLFFIRFQLFKDTETNKPYKTYAHFYDKSGETYATLKSFPFLLRDLIAFRIYPPRLGLLPDYRIKYPIGTALIGWEIDKSVFKCDMTSLPLFLHD